MTTTGMDLALMIVREMERVGYDPNEPRKDKTMSDYDMSIHTNPDARAWAKFYIKTREGFERDHPGERYDDERMMVTWFANAMMAMHDHMRPDLAPHVLPDGSAFFVADV